MHCSCMQLLLCINCPFILCYNFRYLALVSALASGADWVFIPEAPHQEGWEDNMCARLKGVRHKSRLYVSPMHILIYIHCVYPHDRFGLCRSRRIGHSVSLGMPRKQDSLLMSYKHLCICKALCKPSRLCPMRVLPLLLPPPAFFVYIE